MDIWEMNKLVLFILFFIPGFIALKVYDLLVPGELRKASDSIVEAVAQSCVSYAAFSWLILLDWRFDWAANRPVLHVFVLFFLLFISPICLSVGFWRLRQTRLLRRIVRHPVPKPWDYIFSKGEPYWVILELKNGKRVGGVYAKESFASSFPNEEQLYLEEEWELDDRVFLKPIKRSKGLMVSRDEITSLEFYKK